MPEDSLIWAWTSNGKFNVKSAYKVAQQWLKEGGNRADGGGSSNNSGMKAIWKCIWRLNCPNKIKHLFWRACKNIIPTKTKLTERGIGMDVGCDFCGQSETSGHALWSCECAEAVWSNTKLKLPFFQDPPRDFIDIVWAINDTHPDINWELFATTVWSLWNNRNKVRHGGQSKGHKMIVKKVMEYLKEVQVVKRTRGSSPNLAISPWVPPIWGWYKVNTDGAIFEDLRCCGVGVVVRNETGHLMGAMSKKLELPLGVLEVEAKAVEEGMRFAWELGLKEIIIECDSGVVVKALQDQGSLQTSIQKVIEGVKEGLKCFKAWKVIHTCKSSNVAAHIMARNAKMVNACNIWVEESPPILADQIQFDVTCLNSISINEN